MIITELVVISKISQKVGKMPNICYFIINERQLITLVMRSEKAAPEKTEYKYFQSEKDLTEREINEAYELYQELFGDFAASFNEVLEMISDPEAINILVKENEKVVGFGAGVPLSKVDVVPEKLRPLVKFMMGKSFFVTAIGIAKDKGGRPIRRLLETYKELLDEVIRAGYKSIYTLARDSKRGHGVTMSDHLQKRTGARKIHTVKDFVPGEDFDVLRIGGLRKLQRRLEKVLGDK